jgi:probable F420-dependent oxidoreductase
MAVRIGIGLFTGQVPAWSKRDVAQEYRDTIELVRLAEQLGFASAWVSEHHGTSDAYLPSLLPFLAALAQATTRIELGTGVVLTPLHDPIRLAEDAAVVDQLSGGRLLLGLGLGWREEEFRMFRIPAHERLARHVEAIEILRRAWTGRRFTFEGTVFRFDRVRVTPPPARPGGPPILLGGYAPPALRRAGRIADGYLTDAGDPEELRQTIALLDEGARTAGRDPATLRLVLLRDVVVTDEGDGWSLVRAGALHLWGAYEAWAAGHDTPQHDSLEPLVPDEQAIRRSIASGPPSLVAERLRADLDPWRDRRVELVVRLAFPGVDAAVARASLRRFAEGVLPRLRG